MRRFIVIGHRAVSTGDFNLNDLPGSGGRIDILTRCVNSSFFISHDLRRDVELYLIFLGGDAAPKTLRLVGDELRYLNPDERSTGALLRNALVKAVEADRTGGLETSVELNSTPGIYVSNKSFEDVVKGCAEKSEIVYLKEDGQNITDLDLSKTGQDLTFVLGDDKGMTDEEEKILAPYSPVTVSLSPTVLHADHCIILVHGELDGAKR